MTYDSERKKSGRAPLSVVEIYPDICANVYGNSPCTAAIGVTGTQECYNTFFTCQDKVNYSGDSKKIIFTNPHPNLPIGVNVFPVLESISLTSTKIDLKGFSKRATVTIVLKDFAYHDIGIDPYVSNRSFDPMKQGTFWGRFKARNKYLNNRKLVLKSGYIDLDNPDPTFTTNFQERLYYIDRIEGPDDSGTVKIYAKDILKFTEDKNAKIPKPSSGKIPFGSSVDSTQITIPVQNISEYSSSGYVRIDDEILKYTGKTATELTGISRGQFNTLAANHDEDTKVQQCVYYEDETVSDILYDMLVNYTTIDSSFIPKADWDEIMGIWLAGYLFTRLLSVPESVFNVLQELFENAQIFVWWDEIDKEIKLKPIALPLPGEQINLYTDNDLLKDSIIVKENIKERASQVRIDYFLNNQIDDTSKTENYKYAFIRVDTDAESSSEWAAPAYKDIKGMWIRNAGIANEITGRMLYRLADVPLEVDIKLDAKDANIKVGDFVRILTNNIQDINGAADLKLFIVIEEKESVQGSVYNYKLMEYKIPKGRYGLIGANTLLDYTAESVANTNKYAFICGNDGKMSNGDDGYVIV